MFRVLFSTFHSVFSRGNYPKEFMYFSRYLKNQNKLSLEDNFLHSNGFSSSLSHTVTVKGEQKRQYKGLRTREKIFCALLLEGSFTLPGFSFLSILILYRFPMQKTNKQMLRLAWNEAEKMCVKNLIIFEGLRKLSTRRVILYCLRNCLVNSTFTENFCGSTSQNNRYKRSKSSFPEQKILRTIDIHETFFPLVSGLVVVNSALCYAHDHQYDPY